MLQYNQCIASWEGWFELENVLQYSGLYCRGGRNCIARGLMTEVNCIAIQ